MKQAMTDTPRAIDGDDEDIAPERADAIAKVQKLGMALLGLRKEAMDARAACGIEDDWTEDEQYYQSIDAANPEGETNVGKPVSSEGGPIGVTANEAHKRAGNRSSVFIPLTRPYVDAAAARIADMLLPNDDMPWSLKPTPIPKESQQLRALAGPDAGESAPGGMMAPVAAAAGAQPQPAGPLAAPMNPGQAAPASPAPGGLQPGGASTIVAPTMQPPANAAAAIMAQPAAAAQQDTDEEGTATTPEEKAAKAATKQITDWLIECQYHAEFRKMLENAAKLGTGILKGPVPVRRVVQRAMKDPETGGVRMDRVEIVAPASLSVDPRNFFPDPACGEDVQRGGYVWEYDTFSARQVQETLEDPTYIPEQVQKVLEQGPSKMGEAPQNSPQQLVAERSIIGAAFGVWYFHGMVERDILAAAGIPEEEFEGLNGEKHAAIITLFNDTVVKAALAPLDQGGFPYDVMPWQRRAGMIWGMGVARQMRTPQRMVNAAARALMDNAGFTSGPIVGIRRGWIEPLDGKNELTPRKMFAMTAEAPDNAKIGDAISVFNITSAQSELSAIIDMARRMAEEATGLPMLMQGQQGDATDTAAGMTILNNNGSTVLRRIARQADDCVTERHIRRYYHWLMENSDNDAAKGDFQIDARGSTALVDRELANQSLVMLAPQLRADPDIHQSRLNQELLRAHRIDPKPLYKTAAEKQATPPPPPPPQIAVAQIREEGANKRLAATLQAEAQQAAFDNRLAEGELQIRHSDVLGRLDLALKQIAADTGTSLQEVKAMLAKTTMTLNTQIALSNAERQHRSAEASTDRAHDAAAALAEPAGRAEAGHAFTQ